MTTESGSVAEERQLVEQCQRGDQEALAQLRERFDGSLRNIMMGRGANPSEVEEILAEIWAQCVPGGEERPSLLEKFTGKCRLQSWLCRVATNRWLDYKRRERRWGDPPAEEGKTSFLERVPAPSGNDLDGTLVNLLRESVRAAFDRCAPQTLVLLHLIYRHGVSQRELMRVLGWSESKVSRVLSQAMEEIRESTLRELKRRDPWLQPTWEDFLALCASEPLGGLLK